MEKIILWIKAMRLFSLPLVISAVILGSAFAKVEGYFSWKTFILLFITGSCLQILTNFANDYGDASSGVDGDTRNGPRGLIVQGTITKKQMFYAIVLTATLSAIFSCLLIYTSFGTNIWAWSILGILTIITIIAAIRYTMGKNPYGYRAKGDISVFIFFGLVAVVGSYVFYGAPLSKVPGLPACSAGLFATAVLNANNIRDMKSDALYGKDTLALRFGDEYARYYHLLLITLGFLLWITYFLLLYPTKYLLLLFLASPVAYSAYKVYTSYDSVVLDNQVKLTAMATGVFQIIVALFLFAK